MADAFRYKAFISYSHRDEETAKWLHRSIETYRVPRSVIGSAGRDGPAPKRLYPIFRDREELPTASSLNDQITEALEQSACLIVLCSPNSANSLWVNEEVSFFKRMGREDRIICVILSGEPNATDKAGFDVSQECFPPALKQHFGDDGNPTAEHMEPVAADLRPQGEGRTKAKLKIIAGVLGVNFEALAQREKKRRAARGGAAFSILTVVISILGFFAWQSYDQGYLNASARPEYASLELDGVEFGSTIRSLSLRSGNHKLSASAPDHLRSVREIQIERHMVREQYSWVERGYDWQPYLSRATQNEFVLIPRDGDTLIAHNEMNRIIVLSAKTGEIVSEYPVNGGTFRRFAEIDSGSQTGPLLISGWEKEKNGLEIQAFSFSSPNVPLWQWQGPATKNERNGGLHYAVLKREGKSSLLAVAGMDGKIHVLDSTNGNPEFSIETPFVSLPYPPVLAFAKEDGNEYLAAIVPRPAAGSSLISKDTEVEQELMAFRLETGEQVASVDIAPEWNRPLAPFQYRGSFVTVLWTKKKWQLVQFPGGDVIASGRIEGEISGGPMLLKHRMNGRTDIVFDERIGKKRCLAAFDPDNVGVRWRRCLDLSGAGQRLDATGAFHLTDKGDMLVRLSGGFASMNPINGSIRWQRKGRPENFLVADWDGDGEREIFVAIDGEGLVCLNDEGVALWELRSETYRFSPRQLLPSPEGGATGVILVNLHAGLIWTLHGPRELWRQQANGAFEASPIVVDGENNQRYLVQAGEWGANMDPEEWDRAVGMKVFAGQDGTPIWSAREEFTTNRAPSTGDMDGDGKAEILAAGRSEKGGPITIIAYRPDSGKIVRSLRTSIQGWTSTTPLIDEFRGNGHKDVVFNTWDEKAVLLVDGTSGETLWKQTTSAGNLGHIATGDLDGDELPDIVSLAVDGRLSAFRGLDGRVLWETQLQTAARQGLFSRPVISQLDKENHLHVLVVNGNGQLVVLDGRTGREIWRSELTGGSSVLGGTAVSRSADKTILIVPSGDAGLIAYDWQSKGIVWRQEGKGPVVASPVLADFGGNGATVLSASQGGSLFLTEVTSGHTIWRKQLHEAGGVSADPLIADLDQDGIDDIVIARNDGSLHVLSGRGSVGVVENLTGAR